MLMLERDRQDAEVIRAALETLIVLCTKERTVSLFLSN